MQCILCEKPSAAKNYAKALGGQKGTFNGKQYEIVNSFGHIFHLLKNPEDQVDPPLQEKYKSWDVSSLPWQRSDLMFIKTINDGCEEQFDKIREVAEKCDEFVIATDDDPSGEGTLLANEIIDSLRLKGVHYYRSFHVDESPKEIQKAMCNLKDLGFDPKLDPDYKKAEFRSKWDYMSMQWTRVFTKLGDGSLLRQGRLKSYMIWAVGEQTKLAEGYKKIPYYQNRFVDENGNMYVSKKEEMYKTREEVPDIYKPSDVVVDKIETKYTAPPSLYDLSMLSAALASKGFSAKQILDTYQNMYEDSVVSYPRTEDKTITTEQFNEFLSIADEVADVVGVDKSLLTHRTPRKSHVVDSGSHGANRPASNVPSSLAEIEASYGACGSMIYQFLARNSLAMLCEDYAYSHEVGHIKDYPDFIGSANIPVSYGYRMIFNDTSKEDEEDTGKHLGKNGNPTIYEGFPPKPSMPTWKWLASILKKNDVGTGSTRTSTYSEITDSKSKYPLLIDTKGKITMTEYGKKSYCLLKDTHIGDVKLTEKVQQQMRDVETGTDGNQYLDQIASLITDDIEIVKKNASSSEFKSLCVTKTASGDELKCPKCGGKLIFNDKSVFCSNWKDKGCDFSIWRNVCNKTLTDKQLVDLVTKGKTESIKGFKSKAGKSFSASLKLKDDFTTEFEFDKKKTYRKRWR